MPIAYGRISPSYSKKTLVVKKTALDYRNREIKGARESHYVVTALSLQSGDSYWCLVHIKVCGFGQKPHHYHYRDVSSLCGCLMTSNS